MYKLKLENGDWVVVCDGAKALILENAGDAMFPNLQTRAVHAKPDIPTRDYGETDSTRGKKTSATARGAVVPPDGYDDAEHQFLADLAGRLDAALGAGETNAFTIVAAPRALGVLRSAYSPAVRS